MPTLLSQGFQAQVDPVEGYPAFSMCQPRIKVGFIEQVSLDDDGRVIVSGFIYGLNFPNVVSAIRSKNLGLCLSIDNGILRQSQ